MSEGPVGIFDSGIGGLSVLEELRRQGSDAGVLYMADQGFGMYGERTLDEVRRRSELVAGWLIERGASTVVAACNSASAAALDQLRNRWTDVPFVGMEPAVKPAAERSGGTIGVLATDATFQGELFASVVDRFAADNEVITRACPGLAAAIESDDPIVDRLIAEYVGDVIDRGADVVVLGCTHYSLVKERIAAVAGAAAVIDPAPAVARRIAAVAGDGSAGRTSFFTTGDDGAFQRQLVVLGFAPAAVGTVAV